MPLKKVAIGQVVQIPSRELAPHGFTRQFHYSPGVVVKTGKHKKTGEALALVRFHHDFGSFDNSPTERWFFLSCMGNFTLASWQFDILKMSREEQIATYCDHQPYCYSLWMEAEGKSLDDMVKLVRTPKAHLQTREAANA